MIGAASVSMVVQARSDGVGHGQIHRRLLVTHDVELTMRQCISYLLRIPKGWTPERQLAKSDPIVFIHGLGFGLLSVSVEP